MIDWTATTVFAFFFLLVTILGFWAGRWKAGNLNLLHEWGLGGHRFGTIITWFLIGGDFYTAYTVIAVPALVYAVGAYGFFALPYTILVYPIVFVIMPRLWHAAQKAGHVTAADVVYGRYGSRPLELAVAVTGIAGPGGAVPGKPVGTVWLAWATRRGGAIRVATALRRIRGDREAVRRKTVRAALQGLLTR